MKKDTVEVRSMTRKEKEKKLLDALELKVGDTIACGFVQYTIIEKQDNFLLKPNSFTCTLFFNCSDINVSCLVEKDFRKVEEPKKWKDVICDNVYDCDLCPLRHIDCGSGDTLQKCLDNTELDDEEREFYQKRLDREYREK